MAFLTFGLFILLIDAFVHAIPTTHTFSARSPIHRSRRQGLSKRQAPQTGAIGIGDVADNVYSILVSIGSKNVPLVLDTGSSDLWSTSTDCTASTCGSTFSSTPQISSALLKPSGFNVEFEYGDSTHRTAASGVVGSASVGIGSLQMDDQFLAACDKTNISLSDTGLSGILGVGFPNPISGSVIFGLLVHQSLSSTGLSITDTFVNTLSTQGPFLPRLIANGHLKAPMFSITLEREDIDVGGNVGQLTIGELPDGVSNDSLTWVPVRLYSVAQGGLPGPKNNPNELYPLRWEVPIDDVILNGKTLRKPARDDSVGYTALIDSGTSFLAGPSNVVSEVYSLLAGSHSKSADIPDIPCTTPVHLSFVIGGKTFPVDPRDFFSMQQDAHHCNAGSLLPTDPPALGALMSWTLGDPFMKSNLVAFYFGNLTHPSVDPPRMGFLSTVPSNADALFQADVDSAQNKGQFVAASISPPSTTLSAASTNANGVAQAPTGIVENNAFIHRASMIVLVSAWTLSVLII